MILNYNISPYKTSVIPNGIDYMKFNLTNTQKTKIKNYLKLNNKFVIIFHGSLDYGPNRDAVYKINDFIIPQVIKKIPNAIFLIMGRNPPTIINQSHYLKLTGYVPNLVNYLAAGDMAIVPILKGGGTKLKIFDYLAAGLPIVATYKAIEGVPLKNKVHVLLSDTINEEFIENILTLYNDQSYRERLSENCKNFAENYDWKNISQTLIQVYKKLV
jgi:glycosyltransferase involved in cell wall biosynthesis